MADKARTFYNVEAKKFQKKHSAASSLQGEEEDFLSGQFWGLRGGPPSMMTQLRGAVSREGDRKQGPESGQDQIWRHSGRGSSAQAEQGLVRQSMLCCG